MKFLVQVEIAFEAETSEEAKNLCRHALISRGFAAFDIMSAKSEWDPTDPDNCEECGAPPGKCDPKCGQYDEDFDE